MLIINIMIRYSNTTTVVVETVEEIISYIYPAIVVFVTEDIKSKMMTLGGGRLFYTL